MAFKRNDVVELRGKVRWDQNSDEFVHITVDGSSQVFMLKPDDLVLVHPGFAVGDQAIYEPNSDNLYVCEIVAIVGDQAWVRGDYEGIIDMYELKRPEAPEPETAIEQPTPAADGWILWSGGECPLESGTLIDARDGDGFEWGGVSALVDKSVAAQFWRAGASDSNRIVAYRLL